MAPRDAARLYLSCAHDFGREPLRRRSTGSTRSAPPPSRSTTPSTRPAWRSTPASTPSRCPTTCRPGPCTCASCCARPAAAPTSLGRRGVGPAAAHRPRHQAARPSGKRSAGTTTPVPTDDERARWDEAEELTHRLLEPAFAALDEAGRPALRRRPRRDVRGGPVAPIRVRRAVRVRGAAASLHRVLGWRVAIRRRRRRTRRGRGARRRPSAPVVAPRRQPTCCTLTASGTSIGVPGVSPTGRPTSSWERTSSSGWPASPTTAARRRRRATPRARGAGRSRPSRRRAWPTMANTISPSAAPSRATTRRPGRRACR